MIKIKLYKEIPFLFFQFKSLFIISMVLSFINPLITKLNGELLPLYAISGFMILRNLVRLSLQLEIIKRINLIDSFKYLLVGDIILALCTLIYYVDVFIFIVVISIIFMFHSVALTVFIINYDTHISNSYPTEVFKEVKYTEQFIYTASSILGYILVIIFQNHIIEIFLLLMVIFIYIQYYNYKEYFVKIDI